MRNETSGSKSGQLVALVEQRARFTASMKVSDKETDTVAAALVDPLSRRSYWKDCAYVLARPT